MELRAELEAMLSAKLAAEAALATTVGERGVCAAAANAQLALAAEEADRAKEAGLRLLELADHAALVAAAYEVGSLIVLSWLSRWVRPRIPLTEHGTAWNAAVCDVVLSQTSDRAMCQLPHLTGPAGSVNTVMHIQQDSKHLSPCSAPGATSCAG